MTGRVKLALAAAILIHLALSIGHTLTRRPGSDEAWNANPALDLLMHGRMGMTVAEPTGNNMMPGTKLVRIDERFYAGMPLSYVTLAAWYRIAGTGLFEMRFLSVLWGLVALAAVYQVIESLTRSHALAVLTVLFTGVERAYLDSTADGRPDMMSAALGWASMAVYLRLREESYSRAVLFSQMLLAAAIFTHPIGGLAAFGTLVLAWSDRRRWRWPHLALAAAPYLVAAAGWGLYISVDPEAFRSQFFANASGRLKHAFSPWRALADEIAIRYGELYLPGHATGIRRITVLIPILYLLGLVATAASASIRNKPGRRTLLSMAVVYFCVMTLLEGNKSFYYTVHFVPIMAACAAMAIEGYWQRGGVPRLAAVALGLLLFVLSLGYTAATVARNPYRNVFLPAARFLKEAAPGTALVYGPSEFGFVLGFDNNLKDDASLGFFTGKSADFLVIDEKVYRQAYLNYQARFPDVYRHVASLLASYRKIYGGPFYEIYARQ